MLPFAPSTDTEKRVAVALALLSISGVESPPALRVLDAYLGVDPMGVPPSRRNEEDPEGNED
jgi:hypothetical protein